MTTQVARSEYKSIQEKEKIIRSNLPGLMKMVKNEEKALKEMEEYQEMRKRERDKQFKKK